MVKAEVEFCGSHFVKRMVDRGRNRFLKKEYEENDKVKNWCDRLIAIRFDPAEIMMQTYNELLEEARLTFNEGKKGKGLKGSIFRKCLKYWKYGKKVFVNGTHATVKELSCFHRPCHRSNQAIEGSNKNKNAMMKRITKGATITGEHWLQLSAELEKEAMDRLYTIKKHRKWKTKNAKSIARDKAYKTVIQQFQEKRITHKQYVKKVVKLNRESDIPKGKRRVLRLLESDSESD